MVNRVFRGVLLVVLVAISSEIVWAEDPGEPAPQNRTEKQVDIYLSGHVMGMIPRDKDLIVAGAGNIPRTDVRGTVGAGLKAEAYPAFTKKIIGGEIEVFGLGGSVRAPRTISGSGNTQAQGSLIAVNTMVNLMLRYPGEIIQPYVGVGGGTSSGFLYDTSIQSNNVALSGSSRDMAFAYQFLGGVKTFVTDRLFLFGEYKYFGTKYSWDSEGAGNYKVKLDFRTHIVSGGLGWSF